MTLAAKHQRGSREACLSLTPPSFFPLSYSHNALLTVFFFSVSAHCQSENLEILEKKYCINKNYSDHIDLWLMGSSGSGIVLFVN